MQFYECPAPNVCTLDQQVNFYMQTFAQAGIPANVGYEVSGELWVAARLPVART